MVTTRAATIVAAGMRRATICFHLTFMRDASFRCTGHVGVPSQGSSRLLPPRRSCTRRAAEVGSVLRAPWMKGKPTLSDGLATTGRGGTRQDSTGGRVRTWRGITAQCRDASCTIVRRRSLFAALLAGAEIA